jgi:HAD superfamily hydrolase (TIGR01509 family)
MDGTLIDSEHLCNQAFKDLVPEINVPVEKLVGLYGGRKLAWIFDDIEKRFRCSLPSDIEKRYRQRVYDLFESDLRAFPGVHEALASINVPICIATSAPRAKIKQALTITGLSQYFGDNLFSSYDIGSWKPQPDIFLHAAKNMDASPSECLVVEDSIAGIEAALSAGMKVTQYSPSGPPVCESTFDGYDKLNDLIYGFHTAS